MTDRPVRWGILSTGWIAERFVEDLRLLPDAEVTAVGSRSTGAAEAFAQRYGVPRAYGTWAELAADPDVDVIYVANPHSGHYAASKLCLTAGKAVLCEKPFTLERASSAELVDLARRQGVFLMEAMWTRCNPHILTLRRQVDEGLIGTVTTVQADFGLAGPFPPEHRIRNRALGGGALLDLGIYPVTLAHIFLGAPDHVSAWAKLSDQGVDENTTISFGYASGAIASLTCGMLGLTPMTATITGTAGRIELPAPFFNPPGYTVYREGAEPRVVDAPPLGTGYQYEAAEVQRCLRAGELESPLVPWATTLEMMGLLDDIRSRIGVTYDTI